MRHFKLIPRRSLAVILAASLPLGLSACGGDASSGGATGAAAKSELKYSSPLGPESYQDQLLKPLFESITANTAGAVTIKPFYGGALVQAPDTASAVTGGRVDLALGSPQYYPSELPISSFTEILFVTSNAAAQTLALRDAYEENERLRKEWNDFGLEVLVFAPVGANTLSSKEPMDSLDDVRGKQLRAVGLTAQAFEKAGARPNAIQVGEVYEALERGMVDAVSSLSATVAVDIGVFEAAKFAQDVGAGEYTTSPVFMSKKWWDGLDATTKEGIEKARAAYYDSLAENIRKQNDLACSRLTKAGVQLSSWSESEKEKFAALAGEPLAQAWVDKNSKNGFDAAAFLKQHRDRVASYEKSDPVLPTIRHCAEK